MAAESIYKERCIAVDDGSSWAKYMSISGSPDDEYDIISLQYTEEGLLTVDENREGHAAAFGDDIAIECLATEFKREIFVVRRHWSLSSFLFSLVLSICPVAWNSDFLMPVSYAFSSSQILSYSVKSISVKLMKLKMKKKETHNNYIRFFFVPECIQNDWMCV